MASLKKCIDQKCRDCTYDSAAPGTWREQVEACTVRRCALWEVRPVTVATVTQRRAQKANELDIDSLVDGLDEEEHA